MGIREKKLLVYTDGAARGNPGPSASGFAVFDQAGTALARNEAYNGNATNNFAEYTAVIIALRWCAENSEAPKETEVGLFSDSEIVVRQLNGHYKVKSKGLVGLNQQVKELSGRFKATVFSNVPRENAHIVEVDAALNRLLDSIK